MQTIRPAGKQVFAKEKDKETQKGSFILNDQAAEKPLAAEVLAVGRDIDWISKGETIVYKPYASTEFKLNDTDYIHIHE
jgi:co-chaperonin GroES (HSP10)